MSGPLHHDHSPSFTITVAALALAVTPIIFVLAVAARTVLGNPSSFAVRVASPMVDAVVTSEEVVLVAEVSGAGPGTEVTFVVVGPNGTRTLSAEHDADAARPRASVFRAVMEVSHEDNGGHRLFAHVMDARNGEAARTGVVPFVVGIAPQPHGAGWSDAADNVEIEDEDEDDGDAAEVDEDDDGAGMSDDSAVVASLPAVAGEAVPHAQGSRPPAMSDADATPPATAGEQGVATEPAAPRNDIDSEATHEEDGDAPTVPPSLVPHSLPLSAPRT